MRLPGADRIVSPPLYWFALAALVASFFLPPDGAEIIACGFRSLLDVP